MWKTILLFIALSPGMLLTLPPVGNKIVMSGKTCLAAAIVHGILFAILLPLLDVNEGFQFSAKVMGRNGITIRDGGSVRCSSDLGESIGRAKIVINKTNVKDINIDVSQPDGVIRTWGVNLCDGVIDIMGRGGVVITDGANVRCSSNLGQSIGRAKIVGTNIDVSQSNGVVRTWGAKLCDNYTPPPPKFMPKFMPKMPTFMKK